MGDGLIHDPELAMSSNEPFGLPDSQMGTRTTIFQVGSAACSLNAAHGVLQDGTDVLDILVGVSETAPFGCRDYQTAIPGEPDAGIALTLWPKDAVSLAEAILRAFAPSKLSNA